jgi:hypothetical protein
VSGELKALIKKNNIYSKFSAINLGNIIAPFLVELCDMGVEKGILENVNAKIG